MPLSKLERHLTKLPANITVKQMDALESRAGRAGLAHGPRRHAEGSAARGRQDARRAAHRAPQVAQFWPRSPGPDNFPSCERLLEMGSQMASGHGL